MVKGVGEDLSTAELGGSARAAARRDGRGRLATGGGDARGAAGRVGAESSRRRRPHRTPASLPERAGNFGASRPWGVGARPGGRSDEPRGLRAEDEAAARAGPGEPRVAPVESWRAPARGWGRSVPTELLPDFLGPFLLPRGSGVPSPAWPRVHEF